MSDWTDIRDTVTGAVAPTTVLGPIGTPYSMQAAADSPVLQDLGLAPDFSGAINSAAFNPVNVQGLFGGISWNPETRTFTSSLDPRFSALRDRLFSQLKQKTGAQEYRMMREMAAPGMERERLNMENRLFSQGRLGASGAYSEGGEMRSLLDSQQQRDMMMQQQAIANSRAERVNLLNQLLGLQGVEQSLFGASGMMSGYSNQAAQTQAQLQAQQAAFIPNMLWGITGGTVTGLTAR